MPRIVDKAVLDAIVDVVAGHPEGIGRADVAHAYKARFGEAIGSRTMQRHLRRLVGDDRVAASKSTKTLSNPRQMDSPSSAWSGGRFRNAHP